MSTLSTLAGDAGQGREATSTPQPHPKLREREPGETIEVIPYDANLDPNAANMLPWFFQRLKSAGLLELYYPGKGDLAFPSFVRLLSGEVKVILFVVKNPDGQFTDCIGFATWSPLPLNGVPVGNAGFIFLPEAWDRKTTVEACKRGMRYWFEEMSPPLETVLGLNPAGNHLVQRFLHRLGWTRVGELPIPQWYGGELSNMVVWYYTKQQYLLDKEKT